MPKINKITANTISLKHQEQKFIVPDPALDMAEAAAVLGMSVRWFKRNWRVEKLTAHLVGTRTLRWRLSTLNKYLDDRPITTEKIA